MESEVSGCNHRDLKLSVGTEPFWREGKASAPGPHPGPICNNF